VSTYTHSTCKIEPKVGSDFYFFGGSICGSFEEIEENKKIVQKWRFTDWEDNLYSLVKITLDSPEYGETILTLYQSGIPQSDKFGNEGIPERVADGWKNHFWNKIAKIIGFEIIRFE
jgi:activator of HSP90 ATPase